MTMSARTQQYVGIASITTAATLRGRTCVHAAMVTARQIPVVQLTHAQMMMNAKIQRFVGRFLPTTAATFQGLTSAHVAMVTANPIPISHLTHVQILMNVRIQQYVETLHKTTAPTPKVHTTVPVVMGTSNHILVVLLMPVQISMSARTQQYVGIASITTAATLRGRTCVHAAMVTARQIPVVQLTHAQMLMNAKIQQFAETVHLITAPTFQGLTSAHVAMVTANPIPISHLTHVQMNDEVSFSDDDECSNATICGASANTCTNLPGTFRCLCANGYENKSPTAPCEDINECSVDPKICGISPPNRCDNTPDGLYTCTCAKLFGKANSSSLTDECVAKGKFCKIVPPVKNGIISLESDCLNYCTSPLTVTYECNAGFTFQNGLTKMSRQCKGNGKIKAPPPCQVLDPCLQKPCGEAPNKCLSKMTISTASYRCDCKGNYEPVNTGTSQETCQVSSALIPFSEKNGFNILKGKGQRKIIHFKRHIPMYGKKFSVIQIIANGYLIVGRGRRVHNFYPKFTSKDNRKIFAPVYSHMHMKCASLESAIFYKLVEDKTGTDPLLVTLTSDILTESQNKPPAPYVFKAKVALVVTWYRGVPYPCAKRTSEDMWTYQAVLISDYLFTYVSYNYQRRWSNTSLLEPPPTSGIFLGKKYPFVFHNSAFTLSTDKQQGNLLSNQIGRYIYPLYFLDKPPQESQCKAWYNIAPTLPSNLVSLVQLSFACPPFALSAELNPFFTRYLIKPQQGSICYRPSTFSLAFFGWLFGLKDYMQICCYDLRRGLITRDEESGYILSIKDAKTINYAHDECCSVQNKNYKKECPLFYEKQPASFYNRFLYRPPVLALIWGDPHIMTLDGHPYTFNGLGEYHMVKNVNFTFQARTGRLLNMDGVEANATIFVAFVAKSMDSVPIQVEIAAKELALYINNIPQVGFGPSSNFTYNDDHVSVEKTSTNDVTLTFTTGWMLKISMAHEALTVNTLAPSNARDHTMGLMGVFNGDIADDFTLPNGTTLNINSSDESIYFNFGQMWQVGSESIFKYPEGLSTANFSSVDYTPQFVPYFPDAASELYASNLCNGSKHCILDYSITKNKDFAMNSLETETKFKEITKVLKNRPPSLSIESIQISNGQYSEEVRPDKSVRYTIMTEVNATVFISLGVNDPDVDDQVVIKTTETVPGGVITTGSNGSIFTWKPTDRTMLKLSFFAEDSQGGVSDSITPVIIMCMPCGEHGYCDYEGALFTNESYVFTTADCICNEGYIADSSDLCVNDDGCVEHPCNHTGDGVCTDQPPEEDVSTGVAYSCATCIPGYYNHDGICIDQDECENVTTNSCEQNCKNSLGSYSCNCKDGFEQKGNNCIDIDECKLGQHDCNQDCENTPGGYECKCWTGYRFTSGGKICKDTDECLLVHQEHACQHNCTNTIGGHNCSCADGYQLVSDGYTCIVPGIICTDIPSLDNGQITSDSECNSTCVSPQSVSYKCDHGYGMSRKGQMVEKIYCIGQSTFAPAQPDDCIRSCGAAPLGDGRSVLATDSLPASGLAPLNHYLLNDTIIIQCAPGYEMVSTEGTIISNVSITCQASGNYSDSNGSIITGPPNCTKIKCGPPPTAGNYSSINRAQSTCALGLENNTTHCLYEENVTYQCDEGYETIEGDTAVNLTCDVGQVYSRSPPTCQKVSCGLAPLTGRNIEVLSQGSGPDGAYILDEEVIYGCKNNAVFPTGSHHLICQSNKLFNGSEPLCIVPGVPCPSLPTLANGSISSNSQCTQAPCVSPLSVTFTCDSGLEMNKYGKMGIIVCTDNGTFSPNSPDACLQQCSSLEGVNVTLARDSDEASGVVHYLEGDTIRYVCAPNHETRSRTTSLQATCRAGQFVETANTSIIVSTESLVCLQQCDPLTRPAALHNDTKLAVMLGSSDQPSGATQYLERDSISYRCPSGYVLPTGTTDASLQCQGGMFVNTTQGAVPHTPSCLDEDECSRSYDVCQQNCTNVIGDFVCTCHAGFYPVTDHDICYYEGSNIVPCELTLSGNFTEIYGRRNYIWKEKIRRSLEKQIQNKIKDYRKHVKSVGLRNIKSGSLVLTYFVETTSLLQNDILSVLLNKFAENANRTNFTVDGDSLAFKQLRIFYGKEANDSVFMDGTIDTLCNLMEVKEEACLGQCQVINDTPVCHYRDRKATTLIIALSCIAAVTFIAFVTVLGIYCYSKRHATSISDTDSTSGETTHDSFSTANRYPNRYHNYYMNWWGSMMYGSKGNYSAGGTTPQWNQNSSKASDFSNNINRAGEMPYWMGNTGSLPKRDYISTNYRKASDEYSWFA